MRNILSIFILMGIFTQAYSNKIEVTANSVFASNSKKEVRFVGNVLMKQDSKNWMRANEAIVYFDDQNQTRLYEAKGNASFEISDKKSHYKGRSNTMKHWTKESKYQLQGNASTDDLINKRHLSGDLINVDIKSGNASVKSQTNKPVKFIFNIKGKN
jgi:lipopolysaccharide export system protein LptA